MSVLWLPILGNLNAPSHQKANASGGPVSLVALCFIYFHLPAPCCFQRDKLAKIAIHCKRKCQFAKFSFFRFAVFGR